MKKLLLIALVLSFSISTYAQKRYKYVIIPTHIPAIGSSLDPYGISSSLQKVLNQQSIQSKFQQNQLPVDYCETLTVHIEKVPNMFRSKLKVELKDCRNQTIWSAVGTGMSKEFREGYAEAIADALKDFQVLPINEYDIPAKPIASQKPQKELPVAIETIVEKTTSVEKAVDQSKGNIYRPINLYYNYNYFIDVIKDNEGNIELMVINGEQLGYKNLAIIAKLAPSGLDNVYTVEWTETNGSTLAGVANIINNELKISMKNGNDKIVILLQKY